MPQDELQKRITKLEIDLQEAQRLLVVKNAELSARERALAEQERKSKALEAGQKELEDELKILRKQVTDLTSEKEQLIQQNDQLKQARVKPTPNQLIQSFRIAMDQLQQSLEPKPGERVGYSVSQFDVNLKTTVAVDKDDQTVRLVLPEPGEEIPSDILSNVRFTFSTVPKVDPSDEDLVEVPMLLGLSKEVAASELAARGLKIGAQKEQESADPPGTLIGQNPDGGDLVPPESSVDIIIAKDPYVTVPELVGKTLKQAKALSEKSGLVVGNVEERASDAPEGTVISQEPEAQLKVLRGSELNLVIAVQEMTTVPGVTGLLFNEAKKLIQGAKLELGSVKTRVTPKPDGTILEQAPQKGASVAAGSVVSLVVSESDQVAVPSVVNKKLADAKTILAKSGLSLGAVTAKKHQKLDGVVLDQEPAAGKKVKKKSPVNLIVAKKEVFGDVLKAMKDHRDILKTGYTHRTLVKRFSNAGIDSSNKFKKLQSLSDAELKSKLNLRTVVGAKFLRKIIKDVLK